MLSHSIRLVLLQGEMDRGKRKVDEPALNDVERRERRARRDYEIAAEQVLPSLHTHTPSLSLSLRVSHRVYAYILWTYMLMV